MKLTLSLLSLALVFGSTAQAASSADLRKAVQSVSETQINTDLAQAVKNMNLSYATETTKELEYTFCSKGEGMECSRYLVFNVFEKGQSAIFASHTVVVEYQASVQENKIVMSEAMSEDRAGTISIDVGNFSVFQLALAQLEKEYENDFPRKGKASHHPFSAKLVQVAAAGERVGMNGDDDHWETSTNTLVTFGESFDSRVTYAQIGYVYLVRTVDNGDKITKKEVRRLKLDQLLKR